MDLNEMANEIHTNAVEKGWWDGTACEADPTWAVHPRSVGEVLALIHSEVSEALEEYRDGHDLNAIRYVHDDGLVCEANARCRSASGVSDPAKPEGIPIELADIIIRTLDAAAAWGIDIGSAVRSKMTYNETRPHRHGGKLA